MTKPAVAANAPRIAQEQRWRLREFLRVDETKLNPGQLALVSRLKNAATPEIYDHLLEIMDVREMFNKGVLSFGPVP